MFQRTKDQAFPTFVLETVEGTEWQSEEPFEDSEGLPVLTDIFPPDSIEWKRPSELSLGEVPIWHKLHEEEEVNTKAKKFLSHIHAQTSTRTQAHTHFVQR